MVKVVFPSILAKTTDGDRAIILSASTVTEVLDQLITRYGQPFKEKILDPRGTPKRFLNFYVNGKNIQFLDHLDTFLSDKDELTILPSATGG